MEEGFCCRWDLSSMWLEMALLGMPFLIRMLWARELSCSFSCFMVSLDIQERCRSWAGLGMGYRADVSIAGRQLFGVGTDKCWEQFVLKNAQAPIEKGSW